MPLAADNIGLSKLSIVCGERKFRNWRLSNRKLIIVYRPMIISEYKAFVRHEGRLLLHHTKYLVSLLTIRKLHSIQIGSH